VVVAVLLSAWELVGLLREAGMPASPLVTLAAVLAVAAAGVGSDNPWFAEPLVATVVAVVIGLAIVSLLIAPEPRDAFLSWTGGVLATTYLGLLGSSIAVLSQLPAPGGVGAGWEALGLRDGAAWLLALLGLVWACDTGAYAVGRAVGRRPLAIRISPAKTVEGAVGGLLAATAVAFAACWLIGLPVWHALILGPVVGIAAQVGDLAESAIKRAAGAKESGHLIPGHGGILDRIDSLLFAAPVLLGYALVVLGGWV